MVAHRCPCGLPDVAETLPRLADGSPFPTLFYLTCPRLSAWVSTLESDGTMRLLQTQLDEDDELADAYRGAHRDYIGRRNAVDRVDELSEVSAGGMPMRVKCLHALVAHSLAVGTGVNPVGDCALEIISERWGARSSACIETSDLSRVQQ
jgi:hypothetical protein